MTAKNILKKVIFGFIAAGVLAALAGAGGFYWLVVLHPGEQIQQASIEKILAMESPVFYRDGVQKIGVFFQDAHRQYLPFAEIPEDFVKAIVAAEDHAFFEHKGIDLPGMLRALVANIRAGRVVQGGSTITQQAAKNLFKRRDRSLASKLKELLYAWRLEYHYSKENILEFYTNQFYVSGNGRGLGVAARYYFDKSAGELDTLECAFIAGSVKSPGSFNPFTKKTEEGARRARELARLRASYVLRQMYQLGMIDPKTYQRSLDREIPFKQGRMQYALNTIMDLVKEALAEPEAVEAFAEHGIENVATSGIRVITTVEKGLQEQAEQAMRQELSRLDVRLLGYDRKTLQEKYAALAERSGREARVGAFLFGRVVSVTSDPEPAVAVSFDLREGIEEHGRIDRAGLSGLLDSLVKYERERWSEPSPKDLSRLLASLHPGDLVYVRIRETEPEGGTLLLELEKYPEIQGAVLALREGAIRAMVGGMENHFYNRAVSARRPMGSAIKPLVYCAALQLGWNSADILRNERDMFVYQGEAYFPRPDHDSPYRGVSLNWAGVNSENLASIWLLYHLCDRLSPAQFKEVATYLNLAQRPDESYRQFQRRIRDSFGVVVDRGVLLRTAFAKAVEKIGPDLIFEGRHRDYEALQSFHYQADLEEPTEEKEVLSAEDEKSRIKEDKVRKAITARNFVRFQALRQELAAFQAEMASGMEEPYLTSLFFDRQSGAFAYGTAETLEEKWGQVNRLELRLYLERQPEEKREAFWGEVLLDGMLSASAFDLLASAVEAEYARLAALPAYGEAVLHETREFRVLVALHYLIGLSRELGIESRLDPVLSFPLGSNVISLLELAHVYEGLVTGRRHAYEGLEEGDGFAVIERIENSDGEVIFVPQRRARQVVAPRISLAVADILRNVVQHGTGRFAAKNIRVRSADPEKEKQIDGIGLTVPVLGKTGTANRFTNASFAGFVPAREDNGNGVTVSNGYVLAAYVGFDNNVPMERTSTHVTGAMGALPLWCRLANAIVLENDYAANLDLVDFYFDGQKQLPLHYPDLGQLEIRVNLNQGGAPNEGTQEAASASPQGILTTFGKKLPDGRFRPERFFQPYWRTMENGP